MATATIIISDLPDGQINVALNFDPVVTDDTDSMAVYAALRFVELLKQNGKEEETHL